MRDILATLGLTRLPRFHRDPLYLTALSGGLVFWAILVLLQDQRGDTSPAIATVASLLLWQPVIEEVLFRGFLQGELLRTEFGRRQVIWLSYANVLASLAFVALHFLRHPPAWAIAVFIPSLVLGFFRERHASLYPPILLHVYYNTGYFLTAGFPS